MILHTDIPTRLQVEQLLRDRDTASVSIYVPTDPASPGEAGHAVSPGEAGPDRYGVVDETARRVWLGAGRVLAVRRDDIPGRSPVAAILRYTAAPS